MTEQEKIIYNQIMEASDKQKLVTYFFGPFNYDLPQKTEIWSENVGYKYVNSVFYEPLYNSNNELIGYPATGGKEEIINLEA